MLTPLTAFGQQTFNVVTVTSTPGLAAFWDFVKREWLKKKLPTSNDALRSLIGPGHPSLSVRRQCDLIGLPRSTYYMEPASESPTNMMLMRLIDEQHLEHPHMGRKRMTQWLQLKGHNVFIERLWRSLKYEDIYYLKTYETAADLYTRLTGYFEYYATQRPHQSLDGNTPKSVYEQAA